jgi:drug/metabolite transporter (DMT)-like permease
MFDIAKFGRKKWVLVQLVFSVAMIVETKLILNKGVHPLVMTWEILIVAGAILSILMIKRGEKFRRKEIREMFLPGVLGGGLAYWLGFVGLSLTSATAYAFLTKLTTVFTCLLAYFVLHEKVGKRKLSALVLILIGGYIMSTNGNGLILGKGEMFVALSSFCYATSYVIASRLLKKMSVLTIATYRTLFGALVLGLITLLQGKMMIWIDLQIIIAGVIVAISVLSAHKVMRVASASYMVLMSSMIPIATAVIMFFGYGEKMTAFQMGGAIAIISGTLLTELAFRKI